jgi:actin related protein 2/3 complex, subunit 1A/1B
MTLTWSTEDTVIAAGHDCQPYIFSGNESGWTGVGTLDDPKSGARPGVGGAPPVPGRLKAGAFATFRDADSRGQSSLGTGASPTADTKLNTIHQNTITSVRPYAGAPGAWSQVSTSGVDGSLVIWDVDAVTVLEGKMGTLSVR